MKLTSWTLKLEKDLLKYVGKRAKEIANATGSEPNKSAFVRQLIINDRTQQSLLKTQEAQQPKAA